ncbi:SpoIIE family protein phosphatase [Streptomyces spinosirectus]|jgi:PAS domain S-box-containing protein|uniref:PP2C family protein-serine/threonine phosphatase n=1 Tax=Streptomyces TaxID=1883 RepID=UPI000D3CD13B|nr:MULTISPECIES: SpoIIE family protein phosphatase [Streptomyces]MBY8338658.1 SpoIIE family protein phosphatase [Streptomyces plumbidurans]PTM96981.1 PAS domain S-box-containing protein [Streptomyces sp. VMFN-G11Ma]UIR16534.1 SpoIIE family protein phosphatase [Streptomyces spinosirectus]
MDDEAIDYATVFQSLPAMVALLTPELVYADANAEFLRMSGRTREEVVGRYVFDVFPENPDDSAPSGMRNLAASLKRVLETGERDTMALQRYDVEDPRRPGEWTERYWSPVNAPVRGPDGEVVLVVHRVEEVTELIKARGAPTGSRARGLEAELYTRARELQDLNERLREAHAREREVAIALQEAMLPARRQVGHHDAAVRYRPAVGALNVCGDWYDVVDLVGGNRIGVAVGDVVGHGLRAAGIMGQLRSALSAASRVAAGPAEALNVLGRYAHVVDGAESATAVTTFIDFDEHTITYSSAGHPPPVLVHADGRVEFLDQATDPPLDAQFDPVPRPQASIGYADGAILVLYTDGLIERRREDIDTGLARLAESLRRHRGEDPETLADSVLLELLPPGGATDDTALVIVQL